MVSKSLSLLLVLAACVAAGPSDRRLFSWVEHEYIDLPNANMDALKEDKGVSGPLTNEQVYAFLKGMAKIEQNKAAKEYVVMAHVTLAKCSEEKMQATDEVCKATQIASVKRYCEYCQAQQNAYCQKHRQHMAMMLCSRKQAELSLLTTKYTEMNPLESLMMESVCNTMSTADRVKVINDCETLLRLVEKEEAFVSSVIDSKTVEMCKDIAQKCTRTMF